MNNTKRVKYFVPTTLQTGWIILKKLANWRYGFAEVCNLEEVNHANFNVPLGNYDGDEESINSVIDAHLTVNCGFSLNDVNKEDMDLWLTYGTKFRSLIFDENTFKSLPETHYISGMILTFSGKIISLEEIDKYSNECKHYLQGLWDDYFKVNTCFFDDSENTEIVVHLALFPISKE